jgi:sugar phosphate permease
MANVERVACTRRVRTIQNTSLLLIFIIFVVNYMDRGTLSVANPLIRNELGLSVAEMGVLLSAFLWPYAFTLLVAGAIVDRGKPRRVLTISLIVWSIAQVRPVSSPAMGSSFSLGRCWASARRRCFPPPHAW